MKYTFREVATIYTTVDANSEEEAWQELDKIEVTVPSCMEVDVHNCEIQEVT